MIEYKIIASTYLMESSARILYLGEIHKDYCLKIRNTNKGTSFPECSIVIRNFLGKEEILTHHFIEKGFIKFNTNYIEPADEETGESLIEILIDYIDIEDPYKFMEIEIIEIKTKLIKDLKTSQMKKNELLELIDYFLNDDYDACINNISILGEYIAREIVKKIKNAKNKDFRSAVEALTHHKINKKSKINYALIGSLLWPIYYIRNQKLHPYPYVALNKSLTITLFGIFSEIIQYLSLNQFQF